MAVAVTSAALQLGPNVMGNTAAMAIIQTNAGYAADPGHAGTARIVRTFCP
jgi:hypothetical protein